MINGLDIKLGTESSTRGNFRSDDFNALDAFAGVQAGTESLERESLKIDLLGTAMDTIERGQALSVAIYDKTGDADAAIVAGAESLSTSLAIIGKNVTATSIKAGTESVTAGVESAGDVFKSMWDAVKTTAKKVWEYIRNLLAKVEDFIKGLFGKSEDTGSDLVKLLEKAKKEKRTELKKDNFSEDVRKRLATHYGFALQNDNKLDADYFMDQYRVIDSLLDKPTIGTNVDSALTFINGLDAKLTTLSETIKPVSETSDNADNEDEIKAAYKAVIVDICATVIPNDENHLLKQLSSAGDTELLNGVDLSVKGTDVEDKISEAYSSIIRVASITASKAVISIVLLTDNAGELVTNFLDGKDADGNKYENQGKEGLTKLLNDTKKVYNGIQFHTVTVKPDVEDITIDEELIKPMEPIDAMQVAKRLKEYGKKAQSKINKYSSTVAKASKTVDKASDNIEKALTKLGKASPISEKIGSAVQVTFNKNQEIVLKEYKAIATANTELGMELVRSSVSHIIKESVRLYTKK